MIRSRLSKVFSNIFFIFFLLLITVVVLSASVAQTIVIYQTGEIHECGYAPLPMFTVQIKYAEFGLPHFSTCISQGISVDSTPLPGIYLNPLIILSIIFLTSLVAKRHLNINRFITASLILLLAVLSIYVSSRYRYDVGSLYFQGEIQNGIRYLPDKACSKKYLEMYRATPSGEPNRWNLVIRATDAGEQNLLVGKLSSGDCARTLMQCTWEDMNCTAQRSLL